MKPCKKCAYCRPLYSSGLSPNTCHYCLDTGHSRDSDPEHCDKFKPRGKKRGAPMQELYESEDEAEML